MSEYSIKPIARIKSDFGSKFGIPRQAGIVEELEAEIVFEKEYAVRDAIRGIEDFSHLWVIWQFSENVSSDWSPTVRPPRLGGNERKGVFATRSPFRPNALGLSCVRLLGIEEKNGGLSLRIAGADMLDGTPVYDIKPYIPYADCIPDASGGFAPDAGKELEVEIPEELQNRLPEEKIRALKGVLSRDPRPQYKTEGGREYGMLFAGRNIKFTVSENTVTVTDIE